MKSIVLTALGLAAALASTPSLADECAWTDSVTRFGQVDKDTVNLSFADGQSYSIDFERPCRDVHIAVSAKIQQQGEACLAVGDIVRFQTQGQGVKRCTVKSLTKTGG